MTRREQVLATLSANMGEWVDGSVLATERVGGSEGLRRLRELVDLGYPIEQRAHPDAGRTVHQYRLTGAEPTVTAGKVNGSGAERFSPAAPVLDGPRSGEVWRCTKCGVERTGSLASAFLDKRFALAACAGCKQKRLHQRVR